jgi:hypothetical protein
MHPAVHCAAAGRSWTLLALLLLLQLLLLADLLL